MKDTPDGREPDSDIDGVGVPAAVTAKDPALPSVKVVAADGENVGAPSTVRGKLWVAGETARRRR